MTLLTLFNKALKELPDISEHLQNIIMMQKWSEEKSQQAISIVQQIKKDYVIENEKGLFPPYNYLELSRLTINLSPIECGIYNATFNSENILQADKYIEDLLTDINRISANVKFSFGGHFYKDYVCTFSISWEF